MEQREQPMVDLLYSRECPFAYQCLSTDCIECVKMHMEKGAADGTKSN